MNIFQDNTQAIHAVENKQHPKRVQDHEKHNNQQVVGMLDQDGLCEVVGINLIGDKDVLNGVDEKEKENNNKNNLEEHSVKMTHHPSGTSVINLPYFVHKAFK